MLCGCCENEMARLSHQLMYTWPMGQAKREKEANEEQRTRLREEEAWVGAAPAVYCKCRSPLPLCIVSARGWLVVGGCRLKNRVSVIRSPFLAGFQTISPIGSLAVQLGWLSRLDGLHTSRVVI